MDRLARVLAAWVFVFAVNLHGETGLLDAPPAHLNSEGGLGRLRDYTKDQRKNIDDLLKRIWDACYKGRPQGPNGGGPGLGDQTIPRHTLFPTPPNKGTHAQ